MRLFPAFLPRATVASSLRSLRERAYFFWCHRFQEFGDWLNCHRSLIFGVFLARAPTRMVLSFLAHHFCCQEKVILKNIKEPNPRCTEPRNIVGRRETGLLGLLIIHSLVAWFKQALNGPKTDTSKCCMRWLVCGGNVLKQYNTVSAWIYRCTCLVVVHN